MADLMNITFIKLADKALAANPQSNQSTSSSNTPDLYLQPTTVREVKHIIMSLKSKTSAGIDDISSKLLKACCNELAQPLTLLINCHLRRVNSHVT
ncbi:hypothetical protein J6590_041869 [Homalodisca vitripennis]|nr:hypothetical protein J6590_041869 [Homalodisca vitripennis]